MNHVTPLIIGFEGQSLDHSLAKHLLNIKPAGIVLFRRNIATLNQVGKLIRAIRGLLGELIVSIDFEGGLVSRFPPDTPVPPSAHALNLLHDFDLVAESCRIQAELLASLEINLNFAPVLDIYRSSGSGAIGTRAFSSDPEKTAKFGELSIAEFARLGIGTSAKHFPGQGRTDIDTHIDKGEVPFRLHELERTDLYPFRKAIAAGAPSIMVSHLKYTALDDVYPASMSSKIVEGLLRNTMGYKELIITDCVEMASLNANYTPEEIVASGLQAGIDLWISSYSLNKSYAFQARVKRAFEQAIRSDRGMAAKANQSQIRIRRFIEEHPVKSTLFHQKERFTRMKSIHRASLQKIRQSPLPENFEGLMLIELSDQKFSGIDAEEKRNVVSEVLYNRDGLIAERSIVSKSDLNALRHAFAQAGKRRLIPTVLTANAFRYNTYRELMEILKSLEYYIHIALLDRKDLLGIAANEWVTWGFNELTGHVLADELSALRTLRSK